MTPRKNKNETRVVAEINRGPIGPGDSDMWEGVVMRIPAVPPTNLAGIVVHMTQLLNIQGVLALCEFHYCEFHYCNFSKLSTYSANAIFG